LSIIYDPKKLLKAIAPPAKVERLLTSKLTVKKAALSFVEDINNSDISISLDKKSVTDVALKTIKSYKKRIKDAEQGTKSAVKSEILEDPRLLIQRVQNEVVTQISEEIRSSYEGEKYEWLPSDAEVPDPEHQLNYGKIFVIGEGEMPGERIGCRCAMNILVKGSKLELG
jgi:hypothetical protein